MENHKPDARSHREERILGQLTYSGEHKLAKDLLEQLFQRLQTQIQNVTPQAPCEGGHWIAWQAGWEQIDGKTCFVDRITWVCPPNGRLVVVVTIQC